MKKVLIVEDDPGTSEIYSIQFKKEGFAVDVANTVTMATEKITNNLPDLLLLDLNLHADIPGPKDGLDILQAVKENPVAKSVKIIVVSNYGEKDYPQLSSLSELGVAKYFLKVETLPEEITSTAKEILK